MTETRFLSTTKDDPIPKMELERRLKKNIGLVIGNSLGDLIVELTKHSVGKSNKGKREYLSSGGEEGRKSMIKKINELSEEIKKSICQISNFLSPENSKTINHWWNCTKKK